MTRDGVGAGGIGAWSKKGEFLGGVKRLGAEPGAEPGAREAGSHAYLSAGRGSGDREVTFTLHSFSGGYRVLVEERVGGENKEMWLAPVSEEEESYIGLFSEEEARGLFPYLFAALEVPGGVEIG